MSLNKKIGFVVFLLVGICCGSLSAKSLHTQTKNDKTSLNGLTITVKLQHNDGMITDTLNTDQLQLGDRITYHFRYYNDGNHMVKKSSIHRIIPKKMTLIPKSISCDRPLKRIICASHTEGNNKVVWTLLGNIMPNESGMLSYSTVVK